MADRRWPDPFVRLIHNSVLKVETIMNNHNDPNAHAVPAVASPNQQWFIGWIIATLAFPLGGGLATVVVGKLQDPLQGLIGGAIAGAMLGLFQYAALRRRLPISWTWMPATALALAIGVSVAVAVFGTSVTIEALVLRAIPTGVVLGVIQAWLLRPYARYAWLWVVAIALLYPLAWWITAQVIGVSVEQGFIVFGASGALAFQTLTGSVLWWLLRNASRS